MRIKDFKAVVNPYCPIVVLDNFGCTIELPQDGHYIDSKREYLKHELPTELDELEITEIGRGGKGFVIGTNFEPITIADYLEKTNSKIEFESDQMMLVTDWGNCIDPINSVSELKEIALQWQLETMKEE